MIRTKSAREQRYSTKNTTIKVDKTDITKKVTSVTDDGSIVKWEATSLNPEKLTVTSTENPSVSETVTLSKNTDPQLTSYNADYKTWLGKITEVKVGDTVWKKDSSTWNASGYGIINSWINGETSVVLTAGSLVTGENIVTIKAEGYEDVTWMITKKDTGYFSDPTFTVTKK